MIIFRTLLFLLLVLPQGAWGDSPTSEQAHSKITVISSLERVKSGSSFTLGFQLEFEPHWHTYWINPGDSGTELRVKFEEHPGLEIGKIQWPLPKRITSGPLTSFGYEDKVTLPMTVKIKEGFSARSVSLQGKVDWLVCEDTCIPATFSFLLPLPMGDEEVESPQAAHLRDVLAGLPKEDGVWKANYEDQRTTLRMRLQTAELSQYEILDFFPFPDAPVQWQKPEFVTLSGSTVEAVFQKAERTFAAEDQISGLLVYREKEHGELRYGSVVKAPKHSRSLAYMFLLAFLGGVILNLMPCVFPIISIKLLSVVHQSQEDKSEIRTGSLAYAFGVIISFWILALTLIALRESGRALGWGFQLQSPEVIVALSFLFFLLGFNFIGVFDFQLPFTSVGQSLTQRRGWVGHFFTGVLSTVVASPCTAPFMGAAIGFAITQSVGVLLGIFTSLGVGLSLPFLLFAIFPRVLQFLPSPGRWMETLKELMGFPMFGTAIWLLWVLLRLTGPSALFAALIGILILSFSLWAHRKMERSIFRTLVVFGMLIGGLVYALCGVNSPEAQPQAAVAESGSLTWVPFSPEKVEELRKERAVFVDFTAEWCVSCQVNEKVVFTNDEVLKKVRTSGVALVKADWTHGDPVITETLEKFGRAGVPFYILYPKGEGGPQVLPEVLTPGIFMDALDKIKQ